MSRTTAILPTLAAANCLSDDKSILFNLTNTPYICRDVAGSDGIPNVADLACVVGYLFFRRSPSDLWAEPSVFRLLEKPHHRIACCCL